MSIWNSGVEISFTVYLLGAQLCGRGAAWAGAEEVPALQQPGPPQQGARGRDHVAGQYLTTWQQKDVILTIYI